MRGTIFRAYASKAAVQAIRIRGRVQQSISEGVEALAARFDIATKREIRDLKRSIIKLQEQLQHAQDQSDRLESSKSSTKQIW